MRSIHQAMDTLTLKDAPKPQLSLDNPAIPDQMFLPIPKRTPGNKGHHMYYGFPTSEDWVSTYCDQNAHRVDNYDPNMDMLAKVDLAWQLLCLSSGIEDLRYNIVLPKGVDLLTDPSVPRCPRSVPILTVCNTRVGSYMNRPTQSQFDALQNILGAEAGWYVDIYPSVPGK